jgi:aspartate racemase
MLGVFGGMGPMATVDFMGKVVQNTPATCDQDHIQMVVCSAASAVFLKLSPSRCTNFQTVR